MKNKTASGAGVLWMILLLGVVTLVVMGLLQSLSTPHGNTIDWVIGIASFWWLIIIVTLPWNIHFQAREVLTEAAEAIARGIVAKEDPADIAQRLAYAKRWVNWSLIIALLLHLGSALVLFLLARAGISAVGYAGSVAALLLTFLRPLVRGYEYLMTRLRNLKTGFRYPREDVLTLQQEVKQAAGRLAQLEQQINPKESNSWAAQQQAALERMGKQLEALRVAFAEMQTANTVDHARLSREAEQAIAQISADGQFLNHVREIIRFVKNS